MKGIGIWLQPENTTVSLSFMICLFAGSDSQTSDQQDAYLLLLKSRQQNKYICSGERIALPSSSSNSLFFIYYPF